MEDILDSPEKNPQLEKELSVVFCHIIRNIGFFNSLAHISEGNPDIVGKRISNKGDWDGKSASRRFSYIVKQYAVILEDMVSQTEHTGLIKPQLAKKLTHISKYPFSIYDITIEEKLEQPVTKFDDDLWDKELISFLKKGNEELLKAGKFNKPSAYGPYELDGQFSSTSKRATDASDFISTFLKEK